MNTLLRRRAARNAIAAICVLLGLGFFVWADHRRDRRTAHSVAEGGATPRSPATAPAPSLPSAAPVPSTIRWLAVGGGVDPVSNQVSLEQDLALAREVLGPGQGAVLFAGGPTSPVQVLKPNPPADSLARRLGQLFDPRDGREARYRATRLAPNGPATAAHVLDVLTQGLGAARQEPLWMFVASHGEPGDEPKDNLVRLWGGDAISVAGLVNRIDAVTPSRPLRLVMASCFSGGFADIAFRDADAGRGASDADRCGLFAATWDREAAGCDPNPDRRTQESYGIYFFNALRGADRRGQPLPPGEVDLDGDGRVSLLEAHTRVRVASRSLSVPTTTSERWLRRVAPQKGDGERVSLPEEHAVVKALSAQLGLDDAHAARARLSEIEAALGRIDADVQAGEGTLDRAWSQVRIEMLGRWPVLDDPYHPDYPSTVEDDGAAILAWLETSDAAERYLDAVDASNQARAGAEALEVQSALTERLVRALDNLELAARLRARGGADWERYQRLLTCERSVPATRR